MRHIAEAVQNASAYLSEHPDEARYRDAHARARVVDGLSVEIEGPGGESARTDMPRGIGGTATMPSPGWLYRAAAASCVVSLIAIRAASLGVDLEPGTVVVTVDSESDDRGILGLDEGIPAGVLGLRVVASLRGHGLDRARAEAIVQWAVDHCPVTDTTRRAVPIEVAIT